MSRDGLPPPPSTVQALSMAVYPSYAMLAGMQLELFTALENGPSEVNEVAAALGVGPEKLRPLLFALTAAGLLEEAGGRFANTPESDHYLVKGRPHYLGDLKDLLADVWPAALQVGAAGGRFDPDRRAPGQARFFGHVGSGADDLPTRPLAGDGGLRPSLGQAFRFRRL